MDNNAASRAPKPVVGEDLYGLSVHELKQRIEVYTAEITRLKVELAKKSSDRSAADALFGKSP